MNKIKISEIFMTIQGEGLLQGTPSIFIRLYGCNLSCKWCDTIYEKEYKEYQSLTIDEILKRISIYNTKYIVITGGEPLSNENIELLIDKLKERSYHITVETNATILRNIKCDFVSMSPKLSNSNPYSEEDAKYIDYEQKRINYEAINYYIKNYKYQIKFVVSGKEDINEIREILHKIKKYDDLRVLVMPQSSSKQDLEKKQKDIINLCIINGVRYGNRLQLQVWDTDEPKL